MRDQALSFALDHQDAQLDELKEFLSIPSISAQPQHKGDITRAAKWLAAYLLSIGMQRAHVMQTSGHPVVYGEWLGAGKDKPTILVYGHYDVQPEDPLDLWLSDPFKPQVRGQNLYGRGTSDDKGQVFAHVKAVEAYLKSSGKLPVNVKFIVEGEEEIGGPSLDPFVEANANLLAADVVLISDESMPRPISRHSTMVCVGCATWKSKSCGRSVTCTLALLAARSTTPSRRWPKSSSA